MTSSWRRSTSIERFSFGLCESAGATLIQQMCAEPAIERISAFDLALTGVHQEVLSQITTEIKVQMRAVVTMANSMGCRTMALRPC
jgi:hypothetical protein